MSQVEEQGSTIESRAVTPGNGTLGRGDEEEAHLREDLLPRASSVEGGAAGINVMERSCRILGWVKTHMGISIVSLLMLLLFAFVPIDHMCDDAADDDGSTWYYYYYSKDADASDTSDTSGGSLLGGYYYDSGADDGRPMKSSCSVFFEAWSSKGLLVPPMSFLIWQCADPTSKDPLRWVLAKQPFLYLGGISFTICEFTPHILSSPSVSTPY